MCGFLEGYFDGEGVFGKGAFRRYKIAAMPSFNAASMSEKTSAKQARKFLLNVQRQWC